MLKIKQTKSPLQKFSNNKIRMNNFSKLQRMFIYFKFIEEKKISIPPTHFQMFVV